MQTFFTCVVLSLVAVSGCSGNSSKVPDAGNTAGAGVTWSIGGTDGLGGANTSQVGGASSYGGTLTSATGSLVGEGGAKNVGTQDAAVNAVLSGAKSLATSAYHVCVVALDSTVACWGNNQWGQLGNGTTSDSGVPTPVTVTGLTSATLVAPGGTHTCALSSGGVSCWGDNSHGELGNGTLINSSTPVTVTGLTSVVSVAAGTNYTCALVNDGTVRCWGANNWKQLGNGADTDSSSPVQVMGVASATSITAGNSHACALLSDSTVRCWGDNSYGQLGNGASSVSSMPVPVLGVTGATSITASIFNTCALTSSGDVECWGVNFTGQLGAGAASSGCSAQGGCSLTPVLVGIANGASVTSGGEGDTCALQMDGSVQCVGDDAFGQLGTTSVTKTCGGTPCSSTPVTVAGLSQATSISAGYDYLCALHPDGSVECLGLNQYGQLGGGSVTGPQQCPTSGASYPCSNVPVTVLSPR